MILVTPYVKDATNYLQLANRVKETGTCKPHSLLVLTQVKDTEGATEFFKEVKHLFQCADLIFLKEYPRERYSVQNDMFAEAAHFVANQPLREGELPDAPWLYLDPTFHPTVKRWMTKITEDYTAQKKLILGLPEEHPDLFIDNGMGMRVPVAGGIWFNGPVVIDRDYYNRSGLIQNLYAEEHWRKYLRYEMAQSHAFSRLLGRNPESVLKKARIWKPSGTRNAKKSQPQETPPE